MTGSACSPRVDPAQGSQRCFLVQLCRVSTQISPPLSNLLLFVGVAARQAIQMKSGCLLLFCFAGQIKQRCDATAVAEGCTNFPAGEMNLLNRSTEKKQ